MPSSPSLPSSLQGLPRGKYIHPFEALVRNFYIACAVYAVHAHCLRSAYALCSHFFHIAPCSHIAHCSRRDDATFARLKESAARRKRSFEAQLTPVVERLRNQDERDGGYVFKSMHSTVSKR
jgi:hypothetical protein